MKPVRFIESKGLLICGNSGSDVGSAWQKWESTSAGHPALKCGLDYNSNDNPGAFEVRFYPDEAEFDFVGTQMRQTEPESLWDYMQIPIVTYAVFDIDTKIDQGPQFNGVNDWIAANENEYKRFKWDADGHVKEAEFVICVYDHTEKFAKEQIMELWIPVVKVES